MPRQNLQKKSDDRIVKGSKKLNIIIRRKYVLSLSRENEFSSSMTSWNLNLWSYSTDCWKNFWSMKFKLTSVWLSFYQNELPIKKSFYQKNKNKKKKKKPKLHYNRHSWISKKMKMYMKQGVGHQVMKPRWKMH